MLLTLVHWTEIQKQSYETGHCDLHDISIGEWYFDAVNSFMNNENKYQFNINPLSSTLWISNLTMLNHICDKLNPHFSSWPYVTYVLFRITCFIADVLCSYSHIWASNSNWGRSVTYVLAMQEVNGNKTKYSWANTSYM